MTVTPSSNPFVWSDTNSRTRRRVHPPLVSLKCCSRGISRGEASGPSTCRPSYARGRPTRGDLEENEFVSERFSSQPGTLDLPDRQCDRQVAVKASRSLPTYVPNLPASSPRAYLRLCDTMRQDETLWCPGRASAVAVMLGVQPPPLPTSAPPLAPLPSSGMIPGSPTSSHLHASGRPLSIASTSSTSTTSSSSTTPSFGFNSKQPGRHNSSSYLASAESLQDGSAYCLSGGGVAISDDESESGGNGAGRNEHSSDANGSSGVGSRLLCYTDNVVHELLETERAYVHDLAVVIQGYMRPMRECGVREGFITEKDLSILFGSLDEIHKFNSLFLERLTRECSRRLLSGERSGNHAIAVAECFLSHFAPPPTADTESSPDPALDNAGHQPASLTSSSSSTCGPESRDDPNLSGGPSASTVAGMSGGLKVYALYCTNYPRSLQVLSRLVQPESRSCALLARLQLGLGHRMQLGSYLLKPVQRILKYPLLLDAMRQYEKDYPGLPGQELIERALKAMQHIANRINEIKKLDEDAVRVQEVQSVLHNWPGNDLTTYGGLIAEERVVCQKKHLMHIFLFEKMLLITKRKRKAPNLLWYAQHIATNDLMLNENRVTVGDCSFQVLSKSNRSVMFIFETTGRERKKLWCDRLNKIILESLNISPEQRSKILENLRIQRNISKQQQQQQLKQQQQQQQQNQLHNKMHKRASRGLDSLKRATNILHRNRRTSMDTHSASQQQLSPPKPSRQMSHPSSGQTAAAPSIHGNLASSESPAGGEVQRLPHGRSRSSTEIRCRSGPQRACSLRSWLRLKDIATPTLRRHYGQLRRCHSQLELREVALALEASSIDTHPPMQRSVSLAPVSKTDPSWSPITEPIGGKTARRMPADDTLSLSPSLSHSLSSSSSKNRQWRHMLYTIGTRLRGSLISSDSACSGSALPTGDSSRRTRPRRVRDPTRPTSIDSALFYGVNSDESELDVGEVEHEDERDGFEGGQGEGDGDAEEEEEFESNNSSGSFYERNFEMSCGDEIFRDSAIFSEDAISELSNEIAACQRERNLLHARREEALLSRSAAATGGAVGPAAVTANAAPGHDYGRIKRTESGFAEEDEDDVGPKSAAEKT